jgi:hypothetical protein
VSNHAASGAVTEAISGRFAAGLAGLGGLQKFIAGGRIWAQDSLPVNMAAWCFLSKETYMKMRHIVLALALAFASSAAIASQCPSMVAKIDAILATNPDLPQSVLDEVKTLRDDGEKQHADGKHDKSVESLQQALFLLGE